MIYFLVTAPPLILAAWVIWRRRDPVLLASFFVAASLIILLDFIAMVGLDLYEYRPGLFLKGTVSDSVAGGLLIEMGLVASLSVLADAFLPGWPGLVTSTVTVSLLEYIFTKTDLFRPQGWRLWYTIVGFPLFFWVIDRFRRAAQSQGLKTGWVSFVTRLSLANWALQTVEAPVIFISGLVVAGKQISPSYLPNQFVFAGLPQYLTVTGVGYWVIAGGKRHRWTRLGVTLLWYTFTDYLWLSLGVWVMHPHFHPLWNAALRCGALLIGCWIDDLMRGAQKPQETAQ